MHLERKYRDKRVTDARIKSVQELFKRREEFAEQQAKIVNKCFVCGINDELKTIVVAGKIFMACSKHIEAVMTKINELATEEEKPFKGLISEGVSAQS